jgi:hypothetical protein
MGRIFYKVGVVALIIGAIDPLEGSVLIVAGSALLALATWLSRDRHWKFFLASFIMIVVGVLAMFYLSSLGGFGGTSTLSWWWGTLILPYPLAWIATVILLISRAVKKKEASNSKKS